MTEFTSKPDGYAILGAGQGEPLELERMTFGPMGGLMTGMFLADLLRQPVAPYRRRRIEAFVPKPDKVTKRRNANRAARKARRRGK